MRLQNSVKWCEAEVLWALLALPTIASCMHTVVWVCTSMHHRALPFFFHYAISLSSLLSLLSLLSSLFSLFFLFSLLSSLFSLLSSLFTLLVCFLQLIYVTYEQFARCWSIDICTELLSTEHQTGACWYKFKRRLVIYFNRQAVQALFWPFYSSTFHYFSSTALTLSLW